jgi:hypothetical protein
MPHKSRRSADLSTAALGLYMGLLYYGLCAIAWAFGLPGEGLRYGALGAAIGAAIGAATAALMRTSAGAQVAFLGAVLLTSPSWPWAGLLPAVVVLLFRAVRRAVMLSHCDPTAPHRTGREDS